MAVKGLTVLCCVFVAVVGLVIGVVIGYLSRPAERAPSVGREQPEEDASIQKRLMDEMKSENIRRNLEILTKRPHIAGRDVDEVDLVNLIKSRWQEYGMDSVQVPEYNVLLSYPKQNDSNYVAVLLSDGTETDISQRKEVVLDPEQNDPDVVNPFNAYSAAGQPQGDLVYVNYGRIDDFMSLNRSINISTKGKICIARYGKIFRGDKAEHAQEYGCIGLILYSDPADCTVPWAGVYPDSWYLPGTGAERGTLLPEIGDPQTPNYPSIASAWRKPINQIRLPKIPVTPIGYDDAVMYLSKLDGGEVEESWRGGLNITYRYGPGFASPHQNSKMKMSVKTENQVATTHNVIGYIRGSYEPDRYVIFGNHRDAWVFGAIDPSSGTAVMLEMTRAFGKMLEEGWRPRRTLVFCSWGAEEYGLIGSTEWVEEMQKELQARAITYINVDAPLQGNFSFEGTGVSSLSKLIFDVAKVIPNPDKAEVERNHKTIYDTWLKRDPNQDGTQPRHGDTDQSFNIHSFGSLGAGSDYTSFLQVVGVSAVNLRYASDKRIGLSLYPVYHSVYETFSLVTNFVDPDFSWSLAMARFWAEVGRRLSDSTILPIDATLYAKDLKDKFETLRANYGDAMQNQRIKLGQLENAIAQFTLSASDLHSRIDNLDKKDSLSVRVANDQLMQLERAFIDQNPLPGRTLYRHVISAPSQHDRYGNTAFPGIVDAMFDIADDDTEAWDEVKRQYSIVVFHVLSAAATLKPVVPV